MKSRTLVRNVDYVSVDSYTQLDPSWQLLPQGHFLHPESVSLAERSKIDDLQYRYVTIYYRKNIVAHAYFQILDVQGKHFKLESASWSRLSKLAMRSLRPRLLICGHLFRHDIETVRYTDTSLSDYLQAKILYDVCTRILSGCGTTALLLKDLPQRYNSYFLNHGPKCKAMKEDISMGMEISDTWHSFDDYLSALKHKYKQRSKKIRKKAEGLSIRRFGIEDLETHGTQMEEFYRRLLDRQLVKLGIINMEYLKNLLTSEENFHIYGIHEANDTLVGFFTCFVKEKKIDMYFVGYDFEKNRQYNLYFNILFWGLELAIEQRMQYINMGRTALDPKASIGCEPSYTQNFYRIKSQLLNRISQRSQQKFLDAQGEVWEIRRPFNTEYYQSTMTESLV